MLIVLLLRAPSCRAVARVGWLEDVEVLGGGAKDTRQLHVPMKLLHVLLPLVHEVQLWWDVFEVVSPAHGACRFWVIFQRKIPQRELVVVSAHGYGRRLMR